MSTISLNIISLDVPYPPDYGGVIDIFYKIKALHELGVNVHLHCFEYGLRARRKVLEEYCAEVRYYPRKTGMVSNLSLIPYITNSRRSQELMDNINSNNYPVLFEGVHSSYLLLKQSFGDRAVMLRSHNIEHDYYRYLAVREKNIFKKIFFRLESFRLKRLLSRIPADLQIAGISPTDTAYLAKRFTNTFWLPPFHSSDEVESLAGSGDYALYHGNLSVSENSEVAKLLAASFANKDIRLVIAGKAPPVDLLNFAKMAGNVEVIADPDQAKMRELLRYAHVILLPTYQPTGIKLKLIESLYRGRFCIANTAMVENTELEGLVTIEESDYYGCTENLMSDEFTGANIERRKIGLRAHFDNLKNASLLLEKIKQT